MSQNWVRAGVNTCRHCNGSAPVPVASMLTGECGRCREYLASGQLLPAPWLRLHEQCDAAVIEALIRTAAGRRWLRATGYKGSV